MRFEELSQRKGGNIIKKIEEKYKVLKQIGSGMSCTVYLAEHKKLHSVCAVKCISKGKTNSSTFLREAEFLKDLNNLYAPILYDYEEDADYRYLIEEYIDGQSLYHLGKSQETISQSRLMEIAIKICEAIKWLHERKPYPVLYLDLKPEHVIFTTNGVKLVDFGGAVYLKGEKISGGVMGTAGFASPELLRGEQIDKRSDIYSVGAILYWLMTGRTVEYEEEFQPVGTFSGEWNAIVEKCIRNEAGERYSSVKYLIQDIQNVRQKRKRRQLDKSLRIAVTGSQSRVGTTHCAIGMCICYGRMGIRCIYEERNDSGAVQEIFLNSKEARERNGIYYLPGFQAIPKYGQAVCEEIDKKCMLIEDFGEFQSKRLNEYAEADCIIVIAGGKEWEIKQTKELIERYRKRKDMYYVLRTGSKSDFRKMKKMLMVNNLFPMPEYAQPFSVEKKEQDFYKALLGQIMTGMAERSENSEKMW